MAFEELCHQSHGRVWLLFSRLGVGGIHLVCYIGTPKDRARCS